jgi:hypothetical protein
MLAANESEAARFGNACSETLCIGMNVLPGWEQNESTTTAL